MNRSSNLNMYLPESTDYRDVSQLTANFSTLDGSVGGLAAGMAIVSVGNTHAAIASGQYVYIMNHASLSEGLYKATSAISANTTLSGSNVTAVSGAINALNDQIAKLNRTTVALNQSATASRGTITGKYMYSQEEVALNIIFTSSVTASNSPGIIAMSSYKPAVDCALSCIDITSGISSAVDGSVPCGIGTSGIVYIKECIQNHIYAVSGTYIRA